MNIIEATPTWRAVLPILFAAIQDGTDDARSIARTELERMADAADKWNAHVKAQESEQA